MMRETTPSFRYRQSSSKIFCGEVLVTELGVDLGNRREWPKSQKSNYFAVRGNVCEYAPKDMHHLHQQARITVVLAESSIRNIGLISHRGLLSSARSSAASTNTCQSTRAAMFLNTQDIYRQIAEIH
jgi:hypothetical protein